MNVDWFSINMSIDNGDVERRYRDLSRYLTDGTDGKPDGISLQEVSSEHGLSALRGITRALGEEYCLHYEQVYPGQENEQGVAVISRVPVASSTGLNFESGGNKAQIVRMVPKTGVDLVIANLHLESHPLKEIYRLSKTRELVRNLLERPSGQPQFIMGDFNAMSVHPSVRHLARNGFSSVYKGLNGRKPPTFPDSLSVDELLEGRYIKPEEARYFRLATKLAGLAGSNFGYAIDQFFINNAVRAESAKLVGGFSDHKGERVGLDIT